MVRVGATARNARRVAAITAGVAFLASVLPASPQPAAAVSVFSGPIDLFPEYRESFLMLGSPDGHYVAHALGPTQPGFVRGTFLVDPDGDRHDLGALRPSDVSTDGWVVGHELVGTGVIVGQAVLRHDDTVVTLGADAGATESSARGINRAHHVVGTMKIGGVGRAYRWTEVGGVEFLDGLPSSDDNGALDINEDGDIAGWSRVGGVNHLVRWNLTGAVADLGITGALRPVKLRLTNTGIIASESNSRVQRWTPTRGLHTLPTPAGIERTFFDGVNDSGQVVGTGIDSRDESKALRWDVDGSYTELGEFASFGSTATGINAAGRVSGYSPNAAREPHAFVWDSRRGLMDLGGNALALAISDTGRVLGQHGIQPRRLQAWDRLSVPVAPWPPQRVRAFGSDGVRPAAVTFQPPVSDGGAAISGYTVMVDPGGLRFSATSSPISLRGLRPGSYRFTVAATNSVGTGVPAPPSNPVEVLRPAFARGEVARGSAASRVGQVPIAGDFDGDGRGDVLIWGPGSIADAMLYGRSNATFRNVLLSVGFGTVTRPTVGDYNGDGRSDVFWYGPGSAPDAVWLGHDTTPFLLTSPFSIGASFEPASGDFHGDGFDDVYLYAPFGRDVLLRGGARGFRLPDVRQQSGDTHPVAGDFDGDGVDDIFWNGPSTRGQGHNVWFGDAAGFTAGPTQTIVGAPYRMVVGDFDGDGVDDIVQHHPDLPDHLLRGQPDGIFVVSRQGVSLRAGYSGASGDVNGDGRDDIYWNIPAPRTALLWRGN